MATSSPSTNGFGTGADGDKADRTKKARLANFAPLPANPDAPVVTRGAPLSPPKAVSGDEQVPRRSATAAARAARAEQPVDAIHALASAGPAAPLAAAQLGGPVPHSPVRHTVPAVDRGGVAPSRDVTASAAARAENVDVERDAKRAATGAPAAEARPDRREPTLVVASDKAPAPAPVASHAAPASPPAPQAPATPVPGPQAPAAAQPLYDLATADHSLQATALGNNAHLHLDAGAAGPLSLHLSVRDGVADLEVEGPAAERLNLRPEELRRALAGEGLALGHFVSRMNESSDTRSQQDGASSRNGSGAERGTSQPDAAPRPPGATPFNAQTGSSSYGGESRRQWQGETPDPADRDRRPGAPSASGSSPSKASDSPPARRRGVHVTA